MVLGLPESRQGLVFLGILGPFLQRDVRLVGTSLCQKEQWGVIFTFLRFDF